MSEVFDPEKVQHALHNWYHGDEVRLEMSVRASDFLKLLALYREAVKPLSEEERGVALRQMFGNLRGDEIAEGIIRRRRELTP